MNKLQIIKEIETIENKNSTVRSVFQIALLICGAESLFLCIDHAKNGEFFSAIVTILFALFSWFGALAWMIGEPTKVGVVSMDKMFAKNIVTSMPRYVFKIYVERLQSEYAERRAVYRQGNKEREYHEKIKIQTNT